MKPAQKGTQESARTPPRPAGSSRIHGRGTRRDEGGIQELKADKADGEGAVLAKIAAMPEPDRTMAKRLHAIIKASAPALSPRLWYGMPAYAKDDKVVCFFQDAQKFQVQVTRR